MNRNRKKWIGLLLILSAAFRLPAQDAHEIVLKADQKLKGLRSYSEMKITIVRPRWSREMNMKSWSKGDD